jgi:hypothetical protein
LAQAILAQAILAQAILDQAILTQAAVHILHDGILGSVLSWWHLQDLGLSAKLFGGLPFWDLGGGAWC